MIASIILWTVLFFVGVLLIWIGPDEYDGEFLQMSGLLLSFISIIALIVVLAIGLIDNPQEINNYKQQSAYIETHTPENAIEDAALTTKKIELNDWLFNVQFNKQRFGIFSLYTDEVLDLQPIQ